MTTNDEILRNQTGMGIVILILAVICLAMLWALTNNFAQVNEKLDNITENMPVRVCTDYTETTTLTEGDSYSFSSETATVNCNKDGMYYYLSGIKRIVIDIPSWEDGAVCIVKETKTKCELQ